MLKVTVKREEDAFKNTLNNLTKLNDSEVEVGHFEDSGLHYSGMSYVELLEYWARGVEMRGTAGRVIQDVRKQFIFNFLMSGQAQNHPKIMSAVATWFNGADKRDLTDYLLHELGDALVDEYKATFNVYQGPFMDGTTTPLYETGDLKNKTTYKTKRGT